MSILVGRKAPANELEVQAKELLERFSAHFRFSVDVLGWNLLKIYLYSYGGIWYVNFHFGGAHAHEQHFLIEDVTANDITTIEESPFEVLRSEGMLILDENGTPVDTKLGRRILPKALAVLQIQEATKKDLRIRASNDVGDYVLTSFDDTKQEEKSLTK